MFSKYIFLLLYFFNFWGLCTELNELRMNHHRYHKWTVLLLGANIIYLCLALGSIWYFLNEAYDGFNLPNITNDVIKFIGATIAQLFVIFESYYKRSVQRKFWKIIRELRSDFNCPDHNVRFGWYYAKFGEFFGAVFVIKLVQLLAWNITLKIYFIFGYISLMTLQEIRIFHYLFFIHLLSYQLNEVEMEMQSLADVSENGTISRDQLRWIRMYYDLVHELSNCINEIFGWSNVISIWYLFLLLAVDLNWFYTHGSQVLGTIYSFWSISCVSLEISVMHFHPCNSRCYVDSSYCFADYSSVQRHQQMRHQGDPNSFSILLIKKPSHFVLTLAVSEHHLSHESHRNRFGRRGATGASRMHFAAINPSANRFAC